MAHRRDFGLLGLAALSGLLLFLSDFPVHAWPLQVVAFLPLLVSFGRKQPSVGNAAAAGAALAAGYVLPMVVALRLPPLMAAGLAVYQTLLFVAFGVLLRFVLRLRAPLGPLGAGAAAASLEWLNATLIPVWGTAQSYVRVWTALPGAIQMAAITGFAGVVFVLVALQTCMADLLCRRAVLRAAVTLTALLFTLTAINVAVWYEAPRGTVRVAAIGWTHRDIGREGAIGLYGRLLGLAARSGAELVVSPETGFHIFPREREGALRRFGSLAKAHGVTLAVGYFDRERNDNRIVFLGPDGAILGEYVKSHLILWVENYRAGDGDLRVVPLGDFRLGGMICQDDNFTDLSRAYAREGAQVLAVPTNDWFEVKDYHLEACIFRAVESRYGMVRAASNGISAIISRKGEVLARMDHFEKGPGVITATIEVGGGRSFYGTAGDWFPILCAASLAAGLVLGSRRRGRRRRV